MWFFKNRAETTDSSAWEKLSREIQVSAANFFSHKVSCHNLFLKSMILFLTFFKMLTYSMNGYRKLLYRFGFQKFYLLM